MSMFAKEFWNTVHAGEKSVWIWNDVGGKKDDFAERPKNRKRFD